MPYRMTDDSVTKRGRGHPEYSGKSVTFRGEEMRSKKGAEPGRVDGGRRGLPDGRGGISTARDVSSVRPRDPVNKEMPNLR